MTCVFRPDSASIRLAAAAALLGAAAATAPAPAQQGYQAVIVGDGENFSVTHVGIPAPGPTGYVAVVNGTGENLSVEHVGAPNGSLARPGVVAVFTEGGFGRHVEYVSVAPAPSAGAVALARMPGN